MLSTYNKRKREGTEGIRRQIADDRGQQKVRGQKTEVTSQKSEPQKSKMTKVKGRKHEKEYLTRRIFLCIFNTYSNALMGVCYEYGQDEYYDSGRTGAEAC
jgi:hypothetical protein